MKKNNEELIIRVFDENGPSVQEAILEAFRKYLDIELKNHLLIHKLVIINYQT